MSAGKGEPRRRRVRQLTAEEKALWEVATRAVAPLRKSSVVETLPEGTAVEESVALLPSDKKKKQAHAASPGATPAPAKPAHPPLAGVERRLRQRVGRGAAALDARLDLHGHTQDRAYRALLGFLHAARANDAKLVLVITGKGARAGDAAPLAERGVLKRLVPQWLSLPEFRPYVIGFDAAHPTHGGEGALYVRVRRAR